MTRAIVMLSFAASFSLGVLHAATVAADSTRGAQLFETLSCIQCHSINGKGGTVAPDLGRRIDRDFTPASLAATMWEHEPRMNAAPAPLSLGDMREIVSYLWADQFFEDAGNPSAGARAFAAKRCATCHNDASSGAPKLGGTGRSFNATTIVSVLWHHGPQMLDQMKTKGIAWPRFEGQDIANLIAYLNAQNKGQNREK